MASGGEKVVRVDIVQNLIFYIIHVQETQSYDYQVVIYQLKCIHICATAIAVAVHYNLRTLMHEFYCLHS